MSPLQRFHKLSEEKKARILEAAALEFARNGYERASLNRIIRASDISKGAFYYYFEDKADLFVTVCRRFDEMVLGSVDLDPAHLERSSFWPSCRLLMARAREVVGDHPEWIGIGKAFHELPHDQWFEGNIGNYVRTRLQQLEGLVVRGQELGVVRGDLPASVLVQVWMHVDTILDAFAIGVWEETPEPERDALFSVQIDMVQRMLIPGVTIPTFDDPAAGTPLQAPTEDPSEALPEMKEDKR